jgi:hypothetical protein
MLAYDSIMLNTTSPDLLNHSGFRIKDKSTDFKHTRSFAQEPLGAASPAEKERQVRAKYIKKSAVVGCWCSNRQSKFVKLCTQGS